MQILVHRQGQQLGPFSLEELRAALAAGTVGSEDLAWWDGAPSWIPVRTVPGLSAGGSSSPDDGSTLAVCSLVFGIVSFLCGIFSGIPAIICGHMALSRKNRAGISSGRGLAIAGLVMGYLGVVIATIAIGAAIAVPV